MNTNFQNTIKDHYTLKLLSYPLKFLTIVFTFLLTYTTLFYASSVFANTDAADDSDGKHSIYTISKFRILTINSSINPASANYISDQLDKSSKGEALIIRLDTPGGLVSTTKDIITKIGSSNVPVIVWVTPEGASATSAGAIIASSAHLLFMSEGTNIGAATPIGLGSDIKESDARSKAINDLVALVTSLSESRGRNSKAFAQMISKAKSFKSSKAKKDNIIDGIVSDRLGLISALNEREIKIKGLTYKLSVDKNYSVQKVELDPGQSLLNIFANPTTAYILFIIGAALLYFEFQAPGGFVAGAIGALALLLAGIGFQVLPLNFGAMGLILLAFGLFVLEIYVTSYGVLSLAGIASLVSGSLFLFRTDNAYLDIQLPVIISTVVGVLIYIGFVAFVFVRFKRKKEDTFFIESGTTAVITKFDKEQDGSFYYRVKVSGEIWSARSLNNLTYNKGDHTKVLNKENMLLIIK